MQLLASRLDIGFGETFLQQPTLDRIEVVVDCRP